MNSQANTLPESIGSQTTTPAAISKTRPFYWTLRREFWENRYLYIAPLGVAAVFLFGFLISTIHSSSHLREMFAMLPHAHDDLSGPFDIAAALLMATAILMNVFYCAEALHTERRDRSILFWKSLPVSDLTTVLVKASIPLLILPVLVSAINAVMWLLMLLLSSVVLLGTGGHVAALWAQLPIVKMSLFALYHLLTAHALWPAPIYCWLLLVSGWARRAPFLWATVPILAIGGLEKLAFNTTHFAGLVGSRFIGSTAPIVSTDAFPTSPMTHITPVEFLLSPGLWIGLAISAVFLAAAIRLRHNREPL